MTEKVGLIKNPLTIIAIFAGIAEVSGTIVLPFIAEQNQVLFIWFLIIFPIILVVSFFATLNFNNKVLYAPSDYRDEGNYLLSNKYNAVTQTSIIVKEPLNEAFDSLKAVVDEIKTQVDYISVNSGKQSESIQHEKNEQLDEAEFSDKHLYKYQINANMPSVNEFIDRMDVLGYGIQLYNDYTSKDYNASRKNRSIWLGGSIPLDIAKDVILNAKKSFPFLSYIKVFNGKERGDTRDIFLGGDTDSAVTMFGLNPIDGVGFSQIKEAKTLSELHQIIESYKK